MSDPQPGEAAQTDAGPFAVRLGPGDADRLFTTDRPVSLFTTPQRPPMLEVRDTGDPPRRLLTLRITGGRIHVDYDPDDLTDAARALVAELVRIRLTVAAPGDQLGGDPRFTGDRAGELHREVLGGIDRLAATAVDAGGVALAGRWHVGELLAGRGVVDGAEHLVLADQGDPAQLEHVADWCPARVLPMLAAKRGYLAVHAPDRSGRCSSCLVFAPLMWAASMAPGWPCEPYLSHLHGLPYLPEEIADALGNRP